MPTILLHNLPWLHVQHSDLTIAATSKRSVVLPVRVEMLLLNDSDSKANHLRYMVTLLEMSLFNDSDSKPNHLQYMVTLLEMSLLNCRVYTTFFNLG